MAAFIEEMHALLRSTEEDVPASLEAWARSIDAKFFCYLRPYDRPQSNIPQLVCNFPESWAQDYQQNKHFRVDPVVLDSLATVRMLGWSKQDAPPADPVAAKVMNNRYALGCEAGVGLPVRGPNGQFSVLTFWSDCEETFVRTVAAQFRDLHTYAVYLHHAAFSRRPGEGHALSEVEITCLKWTALGKTAWEISVLVSLPERTVHYHLAEASRKLGGPNKTAAVCIALKAGILDLDPTERSTPIFR